MNWIRIALWKLRLVELCVLEDFDGELNLRIIRKRGWNSRPDVVGSAQRMNPVCRVWLLTEGRTLGYSFVARWHKYPFRSHADEVRELEAMVGAEARR